MFSHKISPCLTKKKHIAPLFVSHMASFDLAALPGPAVVKIVHLLPVADVVRAGGVSRVWRTVAHNPAHFGPSLVLRDVLRAPRTVTDLSVAQKRDRASNWRASPVSILLSLARLAKGTLVFVDARQDWSSFIRHSTADDNLLAEQPDESYPDKVRRVCLSLLRSLLALVLPLFCRCGRRRSRAWPRQTQGCD